MFDGSKFSRNVEVPWNMVDQRERERVRRAAECVCFNTFLFLNYLQKVQNSIRIVEEKGRQRYGAAVEAKRTFAVQS